MDTGIGDDFCFFFECQCHACFSPPDRVKMGKKTSHEHYSM
jgi:hypothetical protein